MSETAAQQPAPEPTVTLTLGVSQVNFILQSIDRNPLGANVSAVAPLIAEIQRQATTPPATDTVADPAGT